MTPSSYRVIEGLITEDVSRAPGSGGAGQDRREFVWSALDYVRRWGGDNFREDYADTYLTSQE